MLPAPGEELDLGRWVVGRESVEEYLSAVEDRLPIYADLGVAPPLSLAARVLGALLKQLGLPGGTIHATQELNCRRMVKQGEEVSCVARLSRPVSRGDWRFVSVDFTVYAAEGERVLGGKTTVLVPGQGGG